MSAYMPVRHRLFGVRAEGASRASLAGSWPLLAMVAVAAVVAGLVLAGRIGAASGSALTELRAPTVGSAAPQLVTLPSSVERRAGYVTVVGEVESRAQTPLSNVEAQVEFFGSDGRLLRVESALIELTPLRPGEESPFRVQTPEADGMASYRVRFRHLLGSAIPSAPR